MEQSQNMNSLNNSSSCIISHLAFFDSVEYEIENKANISDMYATKLYLVRAQQTFPHNEIYFNLTSMSDDLHIEFEIIRQNRISDISKLAETSVTYEVEDGLLFQNFNWPEFPSRNSTPLIHMLSINIQHAIFNVTSR